MWAAVSQVGLHATRRASHLGTKEKKGFRSLIYAPRSGWLHSPIPQQSM
jgi:hypothetical protein